MDWSIFTSIEGYEPGALLFCFYMVLVAAGYIFGRIEQHMIESDRLDRAKRKIRKLSEKH